MRAWAASALLTSMGWLNELAYWNDLYRLRRACAKDYESHQEAWGREQFIFTLLAELRAGLAVFAPSAVRVLDLQPTP